MNDYFQTAHTHFATRLSFLIVDRDQKVGESWLGLLQMVDLVTWRFDTT